MKKENKYCNVKISKEIILVCLLVLFFIILVIVGRFIVGKIKDKNNIENEYNKDLAVSDETSSGEINSGETSSGKTLEEIMQGFFMSSGEEVEGIDTLENYELETETLKISDFKVSEKEDRLDITGSIENLSNEKIKGISISTKLYNEKNVLIQAVSTVISEIDAKSSKTYSFSRYNDYKDVKNVKVEILKDNVLQDESSVTVHN